MDVSKQKKTVRTSVVEPEPESSESIRPNRIRNRILALGSCFGSGSGCISLLNIYFLSNMGFSFGLFRNNVSDLDSFFTDPDPGNKKQIFHRQNQNFVINFCFQPKKLVFYFCF